MPSSTTSRVAMRFQCGWWVRVAITTVSMISFPTHSVASGSNARSSRSAQIAATIEGFARHTIARKGGRLRMARSRWPHVGGGSAGDFARWPLCCLDSAIAVDGNVPRPPPHAAATPIHRRPIAIASIRSSPDIIRSRSSPEMKGRTGDHTEGTGKRGGIEGAVMDIICFPMTS
jgi:hypothetical protein